MTRPVRENKLRGKNNDNLWKLPDDILSKIYSMLDIKDAVKTSVLSKRWRYVWTNHPDLMCNHFTILGREYDDLNWGDRERVFVRLVDQIMKQRCKGIDQMNSFCVRFELGKYFSENIDGWISSAMNKGVKTIDLDFSWFISRYITQGFERYNFSLLRTASQNKGSLKHLRLAFCNFRGRSSSRKFRSIVSIVFENVNISDFQLKKVLESCPLLEKLVLHSCSNLTCLSILECNNPHLKILSLKYLKIREIDIYTKNLISVELEGLNRLSRLQLKKLIESCRFLEELNLYSTANFTHLTFSNSISPHLRVLSLLSNVNNFDEIDLCVKNLHTLEYRSQSRDNNVRFKIKAPKLVNALIAGDKHPWYPITTMCLAIPMLQNLVLHLHSSFDVFKLLNDPVSRFSNVKQLVLLGLPHLIEELTWVRCILKCFPMLQTLTLDFERTAFGEHMKKIGRKCANGTVTKLELNGFVGSPHQVDLLKYLLDSLRGLRVLVIGQSCRTYIKFNDWVYSKSLILGEISWQFDYESTQFNSEWIRTIVPPSVRIEFTP